MIALVLMILFCFRNEWFPYKGLNSAGVPAGTATYLWDRVYHLILPVLTLTIASAPSRYLLMRNTVSQVTEEKYVLYAKERGLSDEKIKYIYVLKNIAHPFITMVWCMSISICIGGSLVVEKHFFHQRYGKFAFRGSVYAGLSADAGNSVCYNSDNDHFHCNDGSDLHFD